MKINYFLRPYEWKKKDFTRFCKPCVATLLKGQRKSSRLISKHVDENFAQFGNGISELFGSAAVTQNMHMQMHLTTVVREYGPLYASWLFAFERYNGVLGNINTEDRQIKGQIMSRFMEAGLADSLQDELPVNNESHFAPLLKSMKRVNLSVPTAPTLIFTSPKIMLKCNGNLGKGTPQTFQHL